MPLLLHALNPQLSVFPPDLVLGAGASVARVRFRYAPAEMNQKRTKARVRLIGVRPPGPRCSAPSETALQDLYASPPGRCPIPGQPLHVDLRTGMTKRRISGSVVVGMRHFLTVPSRAGATTRLRLAIPIRRGRS
jgi:hypothetical protein